MVSLTITWNNPNTYRVLSLLIRHVYLHLYRSFKHCKRCSFSYLLWFCKSLLPCSMVVFFILFSYY